MTVPHDAIAAVVLALVILAHAWQSRIVAPARVLSAIGWVVNILAALAIAGVLLRC